ncbi:MAG TPA: phosphotransferase, partial [Acidimicrobiia bacterium]|nr:phosphotransferase [Acidimicrobiia bacterium]
MPASEVDVTVKLVTGLLGDQRPDLTDSEVMALAFGWDNVLFRVGSELVARFPRRQVAVDLLNNEARWLPQLAPLLPQPIPSPVFVGDPGRGYPWPWSLVPWIPGESAATSSLDLPHLAGDLGAFLDALHQPGPSEAPFNPYRGVPLADRDEAMTTRVRSLGDLVNVKDVMTRWEEAL